MIVVACWVLLPCCSYTVIGNGVDHLIEDHIWFVCLLFCVGQSVQSHVLFLPCSRGGGKGVCLCGLHWYLTPLCILETAGTVYGHAALIEFLAVAQHILTHLTQIDIEVAAILIGVGLAVGVDKRVHEPELDVFDVRRLEVCVVEFAHNATPTALGIEQVEVGIDIRIVEVIRSAFGWVERQVERLDCRSLAVVEFAIGPNFFGSHLANIRARHLTKVVLEISRAERRILLRKHAVDVIPSEQGAILAIFDIVRQRRLGEESVRRRVVGR